MRLLVCGDRNYKDITPIREAMTEERDNIELVIHGKARGADQMSGIVAEDLGIDLLVFPAQWDKFGRAAGPIRNQQMLDEGKPDEVWAFHPRLSESKGTKDMVRRARKAGVTVRLFK